MEALQGNTMLLSDEETRWALAIKYAAKEAARNSDHLVELSDYEYAQHAIITEGNIEEALHRIEMMQHFRKEYNISDDPEEGFEILKELTQKQQPWFMVSVDYSPHHGHFIVVYDYARLQPGKVDFPADWRVWLGGLYYIYQLCQCNMMAIRQGLVHICECEGMWYNNFDMDFLVRNWHHLMEHYPLINKECSWLHTPLVGNLQHAFYKQLMGSTADIIRVGCHFEGYDGRIDEIFKMPDEETAEQRLLTRYLAYLRVRYHHQAIFKLPTIVPDPIGAVASQGVANDGNVAA